MLSITLDFIVGCQKALLHKTISSAFTNDGCWAFQSKIASILIDFRYFITINKMQKSEREEKIIKQLEQMIDTYYSTIW